MLVQASCDPLEKTLTQPPPGYFPEALDRTDRSETRVCWLVVRFREQAKLAPAGNDHTGQIFPLRLETVH